MTTKGIGLKQVYPTADGTSGGDDLAIVDIIAVHGINGHRESTFTSNGHFWLRDSLPNWIPGSRVFTYGYNSDIFFSNSSSDLSDWSQKLLYLLNQKRTAPERPIIFICHSLGGIVVKQALVDAKLNPEYKDIGTSTSAVIFLATPHQGSELKDYAKVLEAIATTGNTVRDGPFNLLKENSLRLQDLTQQFRHQLGGLEIVSFFEQIPTNDDILVEKTSAVLNLQFERQVSAEVDHANICKFSKKEEEDEIATMLRGELVRIFDRVAGRAESEEKQKLPSEEESKYFQSLYTSNYESHWRRVQRPVQGTCTWFLQHDKYKTWRDEQASTLLLVTADPGCGKSVLSSFLVDKLPCAESQAMLPGTVCYFFFKDDNDQQKSAEFCLCALLHQLFTAKHSLITHAMKEFKAKGDKKCTEEISTLWGIFRAAVTDPNCGNVICVIDGLDECEEGTRNQLLDFFTQFNPQPELPSQNTVSFLKVIFTSRPYQSIEEYFAKPAFPKLTTIRLRAENETDVTSADIELVIDAGVKKLASKLSLSYDRQKDLHDSLSKGADRTFLWVSLILDMLSKTPRASKREFDKILNNLPRNLDAVYEKILGNSPNSTEAKKILHIVVAVARPLTLEEMNIALAIQPGHKSIEELEPYLEPVIGRTVKELCGLFVRVIDSKIYLVHQTAKEFLTNSPIANDPSPGTWKHALHPVESNFIIANICICYLLFTDFEVNPLVIPYKANIWKSVELYTNEHKFLDYAAKHWAVHFREAQIKEEGQIKEAELLESTLEIYNSRSKRLLTWFQVYWITVSSHFGCPQSFTDLMVASYFGHKAVVQLMLKKGANINAQGGDYGGALNAAAFGRHHDVVHILLDNGANFYAFGYEYRNLSQVRKPLYIP